MKEATGELNMTVIVVTIVAMLSLFFFSVIWPSIRSNFNKNTKCSEAICPCPERDRNTGECIIPEDGMVECHLKNSDETFMCVWKG